MGKQQEQASRVAAVKDAALRDLIAVVGCLEAWAAPIREVHVRNAAAAATAAAGDADANGTAAVDGPDAEDLAAAAAAAGGGTLYSAIGLNAPISMSMAGASGAEARRFEALHTHKARLAKGIAVFNSSPVKGVRYVTPV